MHSESSVRHSRAWHQSEPERRENRNCNIEVKAVQKDASSRQSRNDLACRKMVMAGMPIKHSLCRSTYSFLYMDLS